MRNDDDNPETIEIAVLLVFLFLIPAGDSAFTLAIEAAGRRDYSMIPMPETRVGYCIAASIPAHEKAAIAESLARPLDDPRLTGALRHSTFAAADGEKHQVLQAANERYVLRMRALDYMANAAIRCGYDDLHWPDDVSPFSLGERWLRHDTGFQFFLDQMKGAPPDMAIDLDRRLAMPASHSTR